MRNYFQKLVFFQLTLMLFFITGLLHGTEDGFDLDPNRFSLAVTPKILDDGVQTDYMFGLFYTDTLKSAGEIRLRSIKGAKNDTVWGIKDSLLTRERQVIEVFLLPFNYHFFRKSGFSLRAGAGLYYDYNKLKEKGYFNDSLLFEPSGPDHYNAYVNDFKGHALGPLLDTGLHFNSKYFKTLFSFGVIPIFYFNRNQHWKLSPFMDPAPSYSVASKSSCGPYYYLNFDAMLSLKYITLLVSLIHEYSKLNFTAAGFDDTGLWADVNEEIINKTLALEISALINLGRLGIMPQIGYGRTFDEISGGKNYLLLGAKKIWF